MVHRYLANSVHKKYIAYLFISKLTKISQTCNCGYLTHVLILCLQYELLLHTRCRHELKTLSALLVLLGEYPMVLHKGPVMRSFGVPFVVSMCKLLNKQSSGRWIKTPWWPFSVAAMAATQRDTVESNADANMVTYLSRNGSVVHVSYLEWHD